MSKIRWEEMFPDELLWKIENEPVCYMPYGLAEPHGAYNALGLDWLKAKAIVELAAERFGGVVAPPFCWHITERPSFNWLSDVGVKQPLASAISAELFYHMVFFHLRAMDARGFKVAILVTGHYGGLENDMRLLCEYYTRKTGSPLRIRAMADCELMTFENYRGDHAGICETSQLMALRPELVDITRKGPPGEMWAGTDFPLPDGRMPYAELGEKIVASQIETLGNIVKEELDAYVPKSGWKAPDLYEVTALYNRFEAVTRKYWVCAQCLSEYYQGSPPPFPGWEALGE